MKQNSKVDDKHYPPIW